jgi:hypothetical protein
MAHNNPSFKFKKTRPAYRTHTPPRLRKPQTVASQRVARNLSKTMRLRQKQDQDTSAHFVIGDALRGGMIAVLSSSAGGLTYTLSHKLIEKNAAQTIELLKSEQHIDAHAHTIETPPVDYASPILGLFAAGVAAFASYPFVKREQRMWDQFDDCAESIVSYAQTAKNKIKSLIEFKK